MKIRVELVLEDNDREPKHIVSDLEMYLGDSYKSAKAFLTGLCPVLGPHDALCGRVDLPLHSTHGGGCGDHWHYWNDTGTEVSI